MRLKDSKDLEWQAAPDSLHLLTRIHILHYTHGRKR